jgi:hypothetical protein
VMLGRFLKAVTMNPPVVNLSRRAGCWRYLIEAP